jgi:hypothetical protein
MPSIGQESLETVMIDFFGAQHPRQCRPTARSNVVHVDAVHTAQLAGRVTRGP